MPSAESTGDLPPAEFSILLANALAGMEDARNHLAAYLAIRAYRYFRRQRCSVEDCQDLTQMIVLKLLAQPLSNLRQYDPSLPFAPWFERICKNIWIDELRRRKVRGDTNATHLDEVAELLPAPPGSGHERGLEALHACLRELTAPEFEAMTLWIFWPPTTPGEHGLTASEGAGLLPQVEGSGVETLVNQADIARRMNRSVGYVGKLLWEARPKVKRCLKARLGLDS